MEAVAPIANHRACSTPSRPSPVSGRLRSSLMKNHANVPITVSTALTFAALGHRRRTMSPHNRLLTAAYCVTPSVLKATHRAYVVSKSDIPEVTPPAAPLAARECTRADRRDSVRVRWGNRALGGAASPGPTPPLPTGRWSTEPTPCTCAAVPERNTSSAVYSSLRSTSRSSTFMPSSPCRSVSTVSRVMPGSTLLSSVGVATVLPCTKKMFSPVPSHT